VHQEILRARDLSLYYSPKASATHGNTIHFGHRHLAFTLVALHEVIYGVKLVVSVQVSSSYTLHYSSISLYGNLSHYSDVAGYNSTDFDLVCMVGYLVSLHKVILLENQSADIAFPAESDFMRLPPNKSIYYVLVLALHFCNSAEIHP